MFDYTIVNRNLDKVKNLFDRVPELKEFYDIMQTTTDRDHVRINMLTNKLTKIGLTDYVNFILELSKSPYTLQKDPDFTIEVMKQNIRPYLAAKVIRYLDRKNKKGDIVKIFSGKLNLSRYDSYIRSNRTDVINFLSKYGFTKDAIDQSLHHLFKIWFVELDDNALFKKEYDENNRITETMISSLSTIKDFRRINMNYITDCIKSELDKIIRESISVGETVKLIKPLQHFSKDKVYEVISTSVTNGTLQIYIKSDLDINLWVPFSHFEESKQLRIDKINEIC